MTGTTTESAPPTTVTAGPPRSGGPGTGRRVRFASWRRPETRWAYVFMLPWIIGLLVFQAGPMLASLALSLTDYDVINPPGFVGLENYRQLMADPSIAKSLANTAFYTVLHVPLSMALALGLALLLRRAGRAGGFFRTVFYLPVVTPAVAVGVLFLFLLNGQSGLINQGLSLFGIEGPNWTTDPTWVKPGIVLMSLWTLGTTVVIYLAALNNVPRELYEAAKIDGAGAWHRFRSITIPMISSALFFTMIVNTIASLQLFNEVYTMFFGTQSESYPSESALFYVVYLFQQAFQFLHMGYASAMAWLLFLLIAAVTALQVRYGGRLVYYEGQQR